VSLLTQVGSVAGLASAIFLVWDRFIAGQPIVWPARKPKTTQSIRFLRCMNASKWDIIIRKIKVFPKVLDIARDDSADAIYDASEGVPFEPFLLPAGATYDFPLAIRDGGDGSQMRPFVLIVSWRSTRSTCLPKVAVFMFSSVRAILSLDRQKAWRE
jgi:hypothetical protein